MKQPGSTTSEPTRVLGDLVRDIIADNPTTFRVMGPDETASNRLQAVFEATDRTWLAATEPTDDHLSPDGRVMEVLSEHLCQGWLEGYLLTGRHGLFNCYEAFIHIVDSMFNQHAKWLKVTREIPWRRPIASLNYLLSSHVWRQDHNGFSHQDPGFIDHVVNKKSDVIRVYLPPDANCLLSVGDHCLRSRNYVNVICRWQAADAELAVDVEAVAHCTRGFGIWEWAGTDDGGDPDVVLACAGDVPTLETVAAAALLKRQLPDLKVRVVNVVDLMRLQDEREHPHGLSDREFDTIFTTDRPVIFAFHGYPWLIHRLTYRRTNHDNIHVRGYKEEGTTTTPFDMVMLNDLDRFHLVIDVIDRVPGLGARSAALRQEMVDERLRHRAYTREHGEDPARRRELADDRRRRPVVTVSDVRVLVVNAGSSSLKLSVLQGGQVVAKQDLPPTGTDSTRTARCIPERRRGRRGRPPSRAWRNRFTEPTVLDDDVLTALRHLTDLAPLHQPKSLAGIDAVAAARPGLPTVACFDTAFHATLSEVAYSVRRSRRKWRSRWNVRRFGFHGLSHAYSSRRAPEIVGRPSAACAWLCATWARALRSAPWPNGWLGRHHDGVHAAGRPGDRHQVGIGRPGARAVAAGARRTICSAGGARAGTRSGLLALADADMRVLLLRATGATPLPCWPSTSTVHRLARRGGRHDGRLGRPDVLASPVGGANASAIRAAGPEAGPSRRAARQRLNKRAATPDISSPNSPVRTVVVHCPGRDLEIERGVHSALVRPSPPPLTTSGPFGPRIWRL